MRRGRNLALMRLSLRRCASSQLRHSSSVRVVRTSSKPRAASSAAMSNNAIANALPTSLQAPGSYGAASSGDRYEHFALAARTDPGGSSVTTEVVAVVPTPEAKPEAMIEVGNESQRNPKPKATVSVSKSKKERKRLVEVIKKDVGVEVDVPPEPEDEPVFVNGAF